jgi:hypothetical protein
MTDVDVPFFDAAAAVDAFRRIIAMRDAATDELGHEEYARIAQRLRARWKEWQGEDSLHEMAYGEFVE